MMNCSSRRVAHFADTLRMAHLLPMAFATTTTPAAITATDAANVNAIVINNMVDYLLLTAAPRQSIGPDTRQNPDEGRA